MSIFSKAFFVAAFENAVQAGAAAFAGSLVLTTTPSIKGLISAAVAAGVASLYTFVKAYGGNQALKASAAAKAVPSRTS